MADTIIMSKIISFLYPFLQRLRYFKLIRLFNAAKKRQVKKNGILMLSTSKGALGGNLLAIKSYIQNNSLPYEIKAVTSENMPALSELARELATSRYVMVDDYEPMVYVLKFRAEQELIQVWHAMGAFKKFGYARETAQMNSLTHKNYTKAICSSPELTAVYASSFGISEDSVYPVGTPRTDAFFDGEYVSAARERLYKREPLLRGKRIALFAPTFRGNDVGGGYYPEEWFNAAELKASLGDDWAVIVKLHPFIKNKIKLCDGVFDFSDEREINDILFITDVLVTDYSSVIFENAVIGNAAVLYVPDLEEYTADRGFYYDFCDYACGETVKDRAKLAEAIKSADKNDERMKNFKMRFVSLCDGRASRRFVNTLLEEK